MFADPEMGVSNVHAVRFVIPCSPSWAELMALTVVPVWQKNVLDSAEPDVEMPVDGMLKAGEQTVVVASTMAGHPSPL